MMIGGKRAPLARARILLYSRRHRGTEEAPRQRAALPYRARPLVAIEHDRRTHVRVYKNIQQAREAGEETEARAAASVTIGNFDGVHLGHAALLQRARTLADASQQRAVVLTFWPHPVRVFRPPQGPFEIMTLDQRVEAIEATGLIDEVLVIPFGAETAAMGATEFIDRVLRQALGARDVIVGQGFRFGRGREGTTEMLSKREHLDVHVHEPVRDEGGEIISSSRVRALLGGGQAAEAARLLGKPYELRGEVVKGDARGRELGYPTANIESEGEPLLPDGIYVTTLHDPRRGAFEAITYIGPRPTHYEQGQGARQVETFVLDAPEGGIDLYGVRARIEIHELMRPDQAFESDEALIAQMDRDVAQARTWHAERVLT